jgi:hypothetical protein
MNWLATVDPASGGTYFFNASTGVRIILLLLYYKFPKIAFQSSGYHTF